MSETIGKASYSIHKIDKDFYTYTVDVWASEDVSGNPTKTISGQALGIGQAMLLINDAVYTALEDNGRVK